MKPIKASEVDPSKLSEDDLRRHRLAMARKARQARSGALKGVGAIDASSTSPDLASRLEARIEAIKRNVANGSKAKDVVAKKLGS